MRPHAITISLRSVLEVVHAVLPAAVQSPVAKALTSRSSSVALDEAITTMRRRQGRRFRRPPAECAKRRRTDTKRRTDCQSVESTGGLAIRPTAWSKYVLLAPPRGRPHGNCRRRCQIRAYPTTCRSPVEAASRRLNNAAGRRIYGPVLRALRASSSPSAYRRRRAAPAKPDCRNSISAAALAAAG